MSERFYTNCPLAPGPIQLQGAEAHHLATVCRLRPGDQVCLFNGDGRQYPAQVLAAGRKHIDLQITGVETIPAELPFKLEVAAPVPRGDRTQFLIEKLTELGATSFVPLRTERTVIHPGQGKLEKLERYVIEASKQCGRNVLMQIAPVFAWADYCAQTTLHAFKIMAHVGAPAKELPRSDMAIAVGPEGGFTEEEVDMARRHGWQAAGLGPRILRVETAALLLAAWATEPVRRIGNPSYEANQ
jgi:16S rRNA (uracil1498-N3)-methyltransferase